MKTLLIIDDDERLACVLARRFTATGRWQVWTFASARTALAAPAQPVNAILLDMMLDQEVGIDYIADLNSHFTPDQLIMMTGYASIATTVAALKKGATDYVAKPIGFAELHSKLSEDVAPSVPLPTVPMTPAQAQWEHIQRVLLLHQGNVSATAKALGMHRRTLQRKLQKYSPSKN
ncbi:response regulator transcription factor [Salinimonas sediminis]|uniref:Response regulator n=1 Tax=Salinimonas sediminis TaxID=2303538 RepID=A0A346NHS1_9ALTE|nr:response regulator [Salinimonas sediminis]AXR05078.1 response regulator [Salinimonas sediminis]